MTSVGIDRSALWTPLPGSISHRQREGWGRAIAIGVALGIGLYVYTKLVGYPLTNWVFEQIDVARGRTVSDVLRFGWASYIGMVLLGIVAGGFWEELVFRRMFMERVAVVLRSSSMRWIAAVLASATVDALLHLVWGWATVVFSFQMFLLIGTLYVVLGRDIRPLMVGHALLDVTIITTVFFGLVK